MSFVAFPQCMLYRDSMLIYMPNGRFAKGISYDICRMKPDGTFLGGIVSVAQETTIGGTPYLGQLNGVVRYKMDYDDTLYTLKDTLNMPYCRFIVPIPFSPQVGRGCLVDILLETNDLFVLAEVETQVTHGGDFPFSTTQRLNYYVLYKPDFRLKKVTDFYVDMLDSSHVFFTLLRSSGKKVYYCMNVAFFKKLVEKKLDDPRIPDSLKMLCRNLNEDDNPLLLVGDIKE